jgi:hypothetical protein
MIIGGIILAVVMAFLFGYFVMLLWNWLMPVIFGLTKITYWQAWGLLLLTHLLFKLNPMHHHHKTHRNYDREKFREKVHEKFHKMADEPQE